MVRIQLGEAKAAGNGPGYSEIGEIFWKQINAAEPKLQTQTRSEAVYKILVLSWHRDGHKGMIYEIVRA